MGNYNVFPRSILSAIETAFDFSIQMNVLYLILNETNTQVGGREDSNVYIRMKLKAAEEIGKFWKLTIFYAENRYSLAK